MSATDGNAAAVRPGSYPGEERPAKARSWAQARRRTVRALLMSSDVAAYLISYAVLRELGWPWAGVAASTEIVVVMAGFMIVQFAAAGLYPGYAFHAHELLRRRAVATAVTALAALCLAEALLGTGETVLRALPVLALAFLLQLGLGALLRRELRRHGVWGERVALLASPPLEAAVSRALAKNWTLGLRPTAERETDPPSVAVLAGLDLGAGQIATLLRRYEAVILLADLPNVRISGLQPAALGGRAGLILHAPHPAARGERLRRVADLAVAVPLVLIFAPFIALAGLAIWIADPGPVLYRQEREGKDGRSLSVLKLRTMYRDAEARLTGLLDRNPALRAEWETHFKLRDDPRILPVIGRILRSTSCDELPQLLNVIRGDMSLVGPRPFPAYHLEAMDPEFRLKRRTVMPGLTGLWQVSDRSAADLQGQQQLDSFYIDNRSPWLDAHILLRTAQAVLGRSGAY